MKKISKKKLLNIILWLFIILCWSCIFYLDRHRNARKLNDFLEKPISELNLTTEQKLSDFEYFYDCIVSSVPYETIQDFKNRYGISFIDKYDTYKKMIASTQSDLEFYCVMHAIGEEIPSFHTGIAYPDYDYYKTFGCWNIEQVLDTRYIKSKAQFWNDSLKEGAWELADKSLLSHLFWYKNGQYITDDGKILLEVDDIPANQLYNLPSSAKILYDDIHSKAYRSWITFYSEPYSKSMSEEVKIKFMNSCGTIEEYYVYTDIVAQTLTNFSQALGVTPRNTMYVKDNPSYSYIDTEQDILYLHYTGIGNIELAGTPSLIQSANCKNIIIDLRRNPGGIFDAVNRHLYPFLYNQDIESDYIWYMPETKYTDKMTTEWSAKRQLAFRTSEYHAPSVGNTIQIYKESTETISLTGGENQHNYNVYILTSCNTGSAADTLAHILKENGLATLVGSNTGGEGLMSSFLVDSLPESGLVFTYMPELSFNEQGVNNGVYGTAPHYYVEETYPDIAEYEAIHEDPYVYTNRLEWDAVLIETINMIKTVR